MEEKHKSSNSWMDWLVIALAIVIAETIKTRLNIQGEMKNFFVSAAIVVVLVLLFYVLKYLFIDRKNH